MYSSEKIPLLNTSNKYGGTSSSDGYLLLSVPQTYTRSPQGETTFTQKIMNMGKYPGVIVAVSAVTLVILIIIGVTYHADTTQLLLSSNDRDMNIKRSSVTSGKPLLGASSATSNNTTVEITFPLGGLKGYTRKSRQNREFLAFYKVPYAKPPLGTLRFKDPQPAEKWDGIRDHSEVAPQCIQKVKYSDTVVAGGEEDCLYLNLYTPKIPDASTSETLNYPTMVYIHGGGFTDGNGSRYGPEYMMDEDVILITFQFRLGIFGSLNTGDRVATGNMGFKDQVMVLKWVKEYIKYFGGDPTRVTIFGNSSGGMSVSFLMISPMSNGLFHRAIAQSGTLLCEGSAMLDLEPELTKKAVAENFTCPLSSNELVACLQKVNASDLAVFRSNETRFGITVEAGFDASDLSDVFLPEKPYDLLKTGKVNRVPYIIGINSAELISLALGVLTQDFIVDMVNSNFSSLAPTLLGMDLTPEEADSVKTFYFGDKNIGNDTERNLTNLVSDRIFVHASKVTADFHSQYSDTFLYHLDKRPAKSYAEKMLGNFPNLANDTKIASHADEIQYLFPYSGYPEYPVSDTDHFPFSEYFVKVWTTFAATGRPSEDWEPVKPEQVSAFWYELGDSPGPTELLEERMKFWDQFSHEQLRFIV